jgi:hypothetical protein
MIQQMLEESCFNFTQTWLPAVLAESAWTCTAGVELTRWLNIMLKQLDTLPEDCIDIPGRDIFRTIKPRLAQLRHSAVHRLPLEPGRVLEMVDAALTLAKILRDESYSFKLQALHTHLNEIISQTKRDTEAIHQEVNWAYSAIQQQRKALDRQEQELRKSAAEKISGISKSADSSLLECSYILRNMKKEEEDSRRGGQSDKQSAVSDPMFCVGEEDIESDEDQLKVDLG